MPNAEIVAERRRGEQTKPSQMRAKARICMPTWRSFTRKAFRCGLYEAQDVLMQTDSVDLIQMEPQWRFRFLERYQKRLSYHDITGGLVLLNPGLRKVKLSGEYELFVAVCQNCWDLLYLNAIERWKDSCQTSVCWLDELWAAALPDYRDLLKVLERFDYVFVGTKGAVEPLSKAICKECQWLPGGVDGLRFAPSWRESQRVIDVYSIGRRWAGIHRELLRAAARDEIFYLYDTFEAANTEITNHREHRELFANVAKRSQHFLVAPPKMDTPQHTHGQVEVGYRYFEGAAAGTVMIGQAPKCAAFEELFPWPDAVVEVNPDGSDVREILTGLRSEPAKCAAMGRRNATEALVRHDWIYRWKEMFRIAGVEPSRSMTDRERQLKDLADRKVNEDG